MGIYTGILAFLGAGVGGGLYAFIRQKAVNIAHAQDVEKIQRIIENVRSEVATGLVRLQTSLTASSTVMVQREQAQDRTEEQFVAKTVAFLTNVFTLLPIDIGTHSGDSEYLNQISRDYYQSFVNFIQEAAIYMIFGARDPSTVNATQQLIQVTTELFQILLTAINDLTSKADTLCIEREFRDSLRELFYTNQMPSARGCGPELTAVLLEQQDTLWRELEHATASTKEATEKLRVSRKEFITQLKMVHARLPELWDAWTELGQQIKTRRKNWVMPSIPQLLKSEKSSSDTVE